MIALGRGYLAGWGLVRTKAVRLRLDRLRAVVKAVEDRYKVRVIAKNNGGLMPDVSIPAPADCRTRPVRLARATQERRQPQS